MPRLIGLERGAQVLLQGATLQGAHALDAGLVDEVVVESAKVMAAEAWLLSNQAHCVQPWDRPAAIPMRHDLLAPTINSTATANYLACWGNEPAPLAILDGVEQRMMQPIDGAIRSEMTAFARLIQRPEPRNMICTLFLGRQAYDKAHREETLSPEVVAAGEEITAMVGAAVARCADLRLAGFGSYPAGQRPLQD